MKKDNSFGRTELIIKYIVWIAVTWMLYRDILFRSLAECSVLESKWLLFVMEISFCLMGIFFEINPGYNKISLFYSIVIGYGTYTVLAYMHNNSIFIVLSLLISIVLSVICSFIVLKR